MNLGDLEFKSEDFEEVIKVEGFGRSITKGLSERIMHSANRILREKLSKAPEVFGTYREGCLSSVWRVGTPFGGWSQTLDAHRARLVCIEEIEK